jgi:ribulose-5-phosphate 4-epimerase/fuculose-1-phosphate aldolase
VEKIMLRRQNDLHKFIYPQKQKADVIFKFTSTQKNTIVLNYYFYNKKNEILCNQIVKLYNEINNFIKLSNTLSSDINLIQGTGGNISIKNDNKLIIKSSGISLHQVSILNGFTFCDLVDELPTFDSEYEYINFFNDKIINGDLNPSMEIGFHIKLKSKIVVHTHPIFLNIILCSLESKSIIDMLFKDLKYKYIDYYTPGYELCNNISKIDENIIFLENHGLIVCGDDIEKLIEVTFEINNICKKWVDQNIENYVELNNNNFSGCMFPDAVVFYDELKIINDHILYTILRCSLTPKYLTLNECERITELNSEKKRKKKYENNNTDGGIG